MYSNASYKLHSDKGHIIMIYCNKWKLFADDDDNKWKPNVSFLLIYFGQSLLKLNITKKKFTIVLFPDELNLVNEMLPLSLTNYDQVDNFLKILILI